MSAAFGRLRVETFERNHYTLCPNQPPSGGCVLKRDCLIYLNLRLLQPPSGGCVLKQCNYTFSNPFAQSAAFGRLRVETGGLEHDAFRQVFSRLRAAAC